MDLKKPIVSRSSKKRTISVATSSEEEDVPPTTKTSKAASQSCVRIKLPRAQKKPVQPRAKKPPAKAANVQPCRKLLISVDFGTTYSGIAWAHSLKPDVQSIIQEWPDMNSEGLEGRSSDKVPTEIQYNDEGFQFGYQIEADELRHQGFKLGLCPGGSDQNELSKRYNDPLAAPPAYDKSVETLCTDYLTALLETTQKCLRQRLPASVLDEVPTEYIITMPAVWSELAQSKTLECAKKAGMDPVVLTISEPEAAAVYTLDAMDPHDLHVGDTFVLCDAGGGTVDLISYRIAAKNPCLQLIEAAPGSGDFYGSMFINRRFQELIKRRLSHLKGWDDGVLQEATERFEMFKRSYAGNTSHDYLITVSGVEDSRDMGVYRSKYCLKGNDFKELFEPIINGTLSLLQNQIDNTTTDVRGILLVGGLGQSPYLRKIIRERFHNIIVMQPPNGWTAVARGGLMRGLALTSPSSTVGVKARHARKSYGVRLARRSADGDDEAYRYWDKFEGEHFTSTMEWFSRKGRLVKDGEVRRLEYSKEWPVEDSDALVLFPVIYGFESLTTDEPAKYPGEKGIRPIATLTVDLNKIPKKNIPQQEGLDGRMYNVITFIILVTTGSLSTKYELLHQRHKYGLVYAEYL